MQRNGIVIWPSSATTNRIWIMQEDEEDTTNPAALSFEFRRLLACASGAEACYEAADSGVGALCGRCYWDRAVGMRESYLEYYRKAF